ncbi:MAG: hypothetical protein ACPG5T_04290, partial [Endozoicomonas sp.]
FVNPSRNCENAVTAATMLRQTAFQMPIEKEKDFAPPFPIRRKQNVFYGLLLHFTAKVGYAGTAKDIS